MDVELILEFAKRRIVGQINKDKGNEAQYEEWPFHVHSLLSRLERVLDGEIQIYEDQTVYD